MRSGTARSRVRPCSASRAQRSGSPRRSCAESSATSSRLRLRQGANPRRRPGLQARRDRNCGASPRSRMRRSATATTSGRAGATKRSARTRPSEARPPPPLQAHHRRVNAPFPRRSACSKQCIGGKSRGGASRGMKGAASRSSGWCCGWKGHASSSFRRGCLAGASIPPRVRRARDAWSISSRSCGRQSVLGAKDPADKERRTSGGVCTLGERTRVWVGWGGIVPAVLVARVDPSMCCVRFNQPA